MRIGVPREIKNNEFRVGLTPASVQQLVTAGHPVLVQKGAGAGIGAHDEHYLSAGAEIGASAEEVYAAADMIVKVKEPQLQECSLLRENQILFTYLHLAADRMQTLALLESGVTAIAYETVESADGALPLLAPMSEVAGRLAVQAGARCLEKPQGGRGLLLGGVPGVQPARVLIIGGGIVGYNAALMAVGLGADVTILDRSIPRLRQLSSEFGTRAKCLYSAPVLLEELAARAHLIIGAVLIPGAKAPSLLDARHLPGMIRGAVLVDVAIDQGGCFATSKATTHAQPTYQVEGIVHYCVANMPAAVPHTSTYALNNATLPYVLALARDGIAALGSDAGFRKGLNVHKGKVMHKAVAEAFDLPLSH
jgi:alanine dehydrogenase